MFHDKNKIDEGIGVGRTKGKEPSILNASSAEKRRNQAKSKRKNILKKANHKISWVGGNVFALVPLFACWIGVFLHSDNKQVVENYNKFKSDFFSSGSFLWVSITMLVMSLLELFLYGFKKNFPKKTRKNCKIFLVVAVAFVVGGLCIFLDNIGTPINNKLMKIISIGAFILFAISSGIISFKIVSEV